MTGGGKQTTTSNSDPWAGAQPALNTSLAGAQNLYNAGVGTGIYTGSTVTPWSSQTMEGMNNIQNVASQNGTPGSAYWFNNQDVINRGGYTETQMRARDAFQSIADQGGYNDATRGASAAYQNILDNGGYNDATRGASAAYQGVIDRGGYNDEQAGAINNVRSLANSQYSISPELQKVLDAQATKVGDAVNLNAAGAGRYGSGSNQTLLAKNVGDLTNSTVYNDYSNYLGRRDAANANLFGMGQTGMGNVSAAAGSLGNLGNQALSNRAGAAGSLGGLGNQAINNRSSALGNVANLGQQAFNNIGTAYSNLAAPSRDLMNIGSMYEDLATRQKNDELRIFDANQTAQWDNLSRLNAIASGAGQLGGTKTTSQPGQNPFLTAAGYGLSGLGLLGGL